MSGNGQDHDGHGRSLGSVLSGVAVAVGCVLFLGGFVWGAVQYKPYTVPTQSMSPTVKAGDRVLAQRISGGDVRRGDVVVFNDPKWANVPMLKRVVGIGGDHVACCGTDGRLTINGKPLDEPYLHGAKASGTPFDAKVPAGQVFLLGDDRLVSLDSRVHLDDAANGSVPLSTVTARVDAIAWPMDGMLARPTGFADLPGGISSPGPVKLILGAIVAGAVLIVAGAAHGPVAGLARRRRTRTTAPAGR
ncbi:signal peptidase I [Streptomyces xanthochromogenes]|uniref:Signal peptidase I n=1 Tax=Streptomyces xanthochromogenes TaxID=67384 RepID=A0ABQ3API1_9ACTN|nr:signal peptidase I [Streptomyces xanthochromogenes]GGY63257.1 signal peptidase I [Streptomyces xanthochromogenes]